MRIEKMEAVIPVLSTFKAA